MKSVEKPGFVVEQEPDRVQRGKVIGGAVLATLATALSLGITALFLRGTPAPPDVAAPAASSTVERTLFASPARGLSLRSEQRARLDRFGWVDRDAGLAEIPIERAMDIVADGGMAP